MILMIDNYDSFTFNIVQYLGELGADVLVKRNNEISIDEIKTLDPDRIVISPGPCTPNEAGVSIEVVKTFVCTNQFWEFVLVIKRSDKLLEVK